MLLLLPAAISHFRGTSFADGICFSLTWFGIPPSAFVLLSYNSTFHRLLYLLFSPLLNHVDPASTTKHFSKMKVSSLYFALGIAPSAICAPTPRGSMDRAADSSVRRQGVPTQPKVWSTGDSLNHAPKPATRDLPSRHPRPELFYPMTGGAPAALTRHWNDRISSARSPQPNARTPTPKTDAKPAPHQPHDGKEISKLLGMDTGASHAGGPCHHGVFSRERNDMLIVFLAVAFMGVVVVMETWGRIFPRQGAIRLEETACQPPISIRVTPAPDDEDGIGDEKGRMESDGKCSS